ncbi:glycosyltransferase family 4 protein [Aridibaculum aurantiacum]|uniref:glycosyltransferase family 4 protein n=1 Tax=Aridibaculum aurantiacum TaxID=2810307 RepID=UPI001A96552F|nr:glycosyltransferase family 4 protein [Aridibaculum aurantiacum]
MRILVIHCAYLYKGGEDVVVQQEMNLLQQHGHEVELLQFKNEGRQLLKLLQLPFNLSSYLKTKKIVKSFKPDIAHIHNLHFAASPSVLFALKHCNIPVVMTLHNYRILCPSATLYVEGEIFHQSLQQDFPVMAVKKGVYKNSKLITLWLAICMALHRKLNTYHIPARMICLTEHAKEIFKNSNLNLKRHQLVVKPNFSTPPHQEIQPRGDHFLYVGRLTEEKGILLLLETFALSSITILIAGDGPLREEVESYASKYSNIYYLGILDKSRINAAMQAATALVFPSKWYEGMPLTIIESFAGRLPVIASNLGAMKSMIEDSYNGLHFEAGNKADFQKAIYRWANLPEHEKEEYRSNARTTYERLYSPDKNLQHLLFIYRSALEKAEAPAFSFV